MASYVETPTRSDTAAGAIAQHLRVKTPGAVAVADAADVSIGTMELPCLAAGPCTVRLRSAQGTRKMVAVDAITKGNTVYGADSGKISATGTVREGIAMETSTADNDVIEVMDAVHVDLVASGGITLPTVTFNGLTTVNKIAMPDHLADALSVVEGANKYLTFTTTNSGEKIVAEKAVEFSSTVDVTGVTSLDGNVANAAGSGIATHAAVFKTSVERFGDIIKTSILIDLTGLNSGDATGDIIGEAGTANSHIGQVTAAVNGTIVAGRVTCLETPTGGEPDIDLYSATESTGTEDAGIAALTETELLAAGADWASTTAPKGLTANPAADQYLYLVADGGATDDTYSAGIMLIELWGTA